MFSQQKVKTNLRNKSHIQFHVNCDIFKKYCKVKALYLFISFFYYPHNKYIKNENVIIPNINFAYYLSPRLLTSEISVDGSEKLTAVGSQMLCEASVKHLLVRECLYYPTEEGEMVQGYNLIKFLNKGECCRNI